MLSAMMEKLIPICFFHFSMTTLLQLGVYRKIIVGKCSYVQVMRNALIMQM